jgi:hypothetical protein
MFSSYGLERRPYRKSAMDEFADRRLDAWVEDWDMARDARGEIYEGIDLAEGRVKTQEWNERLQAACLLLTTTEREVLDLEGNVEKDADGNTIMEYVPNNFIDAYLTIEPIQGKLSPRYQLDYFAMKNGMEDALRSCAKIGRAQWGERWVRLRNQYRDPYLRRFANKRR